MNADELRSSTATMRNAVHRVARERHDDWVGPFPALTTALAELARTDLCLARLVEGHADAMRILDQAGVEPRPGVYGVWASRSAGTGLTADAHDDGWRLHGEARFCSGIDIVDRALAPGWLDTDTHVLLDVDATAVDADRTSWHTSAMDASRSFTVQVDLAVGHDDAVGPPGFYLERPGFPIGGLEVAAVWAGGARSVLELVVDGLRRFRPTAHQLRRLGVMEQAVWEAQTAVESAAHRVAGLEGNRLVRETTAARTAVVTAAERVVDEATRIVGPAGLSGNGRLARTLADLTIYLRQQNLDAAWEAGGRQALEERETTG